MTDDKFLADVRTHAISRTRSESFQMSDPAYALIGKLLGAIINIFFGGWIVTLLLPRIAGMSVKYMKTVGAAAIGYAASYAVGFCIGLLSGPRGGWGSNFAVLLAVSVVIQAAVYSVMLKGNDGTTLSYGKACVASVLQVGACAIVLVVLVLLITGAVTLGAT